MDRRLQRSSIPEDQRNRITTRLNGLEGEALVRETRTLDHALRSDNARSAVQTYDELNTMAARTPRAGQRLDGATREALVRGVADRRSSSDTGREGVLTPHTARRSAQALVDMPQAQYDQTRGLLDRAGQDSNGRRVRGSDPHAERSLILKAVGARGSQLRETDADREAARRHQCRETPALRAMGEVSQFANDIRGERRRDLMNSTTLLDIDSRNTSRTDPDNLRARDRRGDNDGLYQRWDMSCGPTTSQMIRGEADPVFARSIHRGEGIANPNLGTATAREQRRVLENNGGVAVSRQGNQATARLAQTAGRLSNRQLTPAQRNALVSNLSGQPHNAADYSAGLARVRRADHGHPTNDELAAIRLNQTPAPGAATGPRQGVGMDLTDALRPIATPRTGLNYTTQGTGGGISGGNLTTVDNTLRDGRDVPFRVAKNDNSSGHFMMISDARGTGRNRRYLVSDPLSGRTAWVAQNRLQDGTFLNRQFGRSQTQITHIYPSTPRAMIGLGMIMLGVTLQACKDRPVTETNSWKSVASASAHYARDPVEGLQAELEKLEPKVAAQIETKLNAIAACPRTADGVRSAAKLALAEMSGVNDPDWAGSGDGINRRTYRRLATRVLFGLVAKSARDIEAVKEGAKLLKTLKTLASLASLAPNEQIWLSEEARRAWDPDFFDKANGKG